MPDSDVTKMKVADLKRELKLRGLPTTGNKIELQERLQTALIEGEISLDDTVLHDVDDVGVLDDDVDLSDVEDHKLLADENELLKSPRALTPDLTDSLDDASKSSKVESKGANNATTNATAPKKIILKRDNSQSLLKSDTKVSITTAAATAAETSAVPTTTSGNEITTPSKHKPIVCSFKNDDKATPAPEADLNKNKKITEMTSQERMNMRLKKFGITPAEAAAASTTTKNKNSNIISKDEKLKAINKISSASILASKGNKETEELQIEALKRRAERFGCMSSAKLAKQDAVDKLQKRAERFGLAADANNTNAGATKIAVKTTNDTKANNTTDVWAEKAKARLERFKGQKSNEVISATAIKAVDNGDN